MSLFCRPYIELLFIAAVYMYICVYLAPFLAPFFGVSRLWYWAVFSLITTVKISCSSLNIFLSMCYIFHEIRKISNSCTELQLRSSNSKSSQVSPSYISRMITILCNYRPIFVHVPLQYITNILPIYCNILPFIYDNKRVTWLRPLQMVYLPYATVTLSYLCRHTCICRTIACKNRQASRHVDCLLLLL